VSTGIYGNIRTSDVDINDIDIYYNYTPNRETENNNIIKIDDPTSLLSYNYLPDNDDNYIAGNENILEGLYNLKLPATIFNQLGFYTIFIKPKTLTTTIIDCSVLSSLPTVKGIVLDTNLLPENLRTNNALQGYKVEYVDINNGKKIRNLVRYVVTSNKVVPVNENVGNSSQRSTRYRFDDSGSLVFLQLTPSSSSNVKPNVLPYIGTPTQTIILSNSFFTPTSIEVEMVESNIETLTELVAGEKILDVDNGILTLYDKNREITRQFNEFEIKDDVNDVSLYTVRERRTNIDTTQTFNNITGDLV